MRSLPAAGLGVFLGLLWLMLTFGPGVGRMARTAAAMAALRGCTTDTECEAAWARVQAEGRR